VVQPVDETGVVLERGPGRELLESWRLPLCDFHHRTEPNALGSRVRRDLFVGGANGTSVELGHERHRTTDAWKLRWTRTSPGERSLERSLHQSILPRVVTEHHHSPSGDEATNRSVECDLKLVEFCVHGNAKRLKGSLCWVASSTHGCRDCLGHDVSEFSGRRQWPSRNDGLRNSPSESIFAVFSEQIGEYIEVNGVHEVCCGLSGALIHPHVEWSICPIAEPPVGIIELWRGHPEIEEHADERKRRAISIHRPRATSSLAIVDDVAERVEGR
jgi:hypothetical protein